jgi:glycosyltransferase involved in cell wall biosynthesis
MKVSICSAIKDQTKFLEGMIASVVGQSFKDWELIIVDDGSTEDVKAKVEYWNDERIKYHRFPENRGVPHGINYALSMAVGEYVAVLSADERLDLNKLLWQVGYLDDHGDIGGIWGLPQNGDLGERPEWEQYSLKAHNRSREAWIRTLLNCESIPIGGASWLVRRGILEDIGYFDPQFYTCSDLELFIRFFEKYDGVIMPYRWAWGEENEAALHKNVTAEQFQADIVRVRAAHPMVFPPVTGRVTVAIPVKDMAKFIPFTLDALKAQTFKDFDIVILDDCSTDTTVLTVEAWVIAHEAANVTVLQLHGESVGPNAAQNHMLGICKTEFFVVLAADDTVETNFLERCLDQFKADHWLEFIGTQTDFITEDGAPYEDPHPFKSIVRASNKSREQWLYQLYYGNHYFGAGMYRTNALKQVGGWDTNVGVLGDYDMYLKMLQRENIYVIEEYLVHTRIHENNRSILKERQDQIKLRQDYHIIKSRYYAPRMKVIFATPFYEMKGFTPYISCLVETTKALTKIGIENEFWELSGDSYIDRAKNTLMNKFLEDPAATDLFMIDADMQWNIQSVLNMLMMPEDIVMGSYPQKNGWDKWTAIPVVEQQPDDPPGRGHARGRVLADGSALIEAAYLAGGFIRIKRAALQKYKDHYTEFVYHDAGADPSYPERLYTEFFTCERKRNAAGIPMRWGEDRIFGARMEEIGIKGWIYPNIDFGHYGIKGWMGNFDKHLRTGATAQ